MADHDDHDISELASAYLDGEVTADERARVESDTAVLAEVERLRRVRSALRDVAPPSEASKTSAIAAALSTFDEQTGRTTPRSTPTNVVPLAGRRTARWMKAVSAAAAAAVLVLGGLLIAGRGSEDHDADEAEVQLASEEASDTDVVVRATPSSTTAVAATATPTDAPMMAAAPISTEAGDAAAEFAEPLSDALSVPADAAGAATTPPLIRDAGTLRLIAESLGESLQSLDTVVSDCESDPRSLTADATFEDTAGGTIDVVVATTSDGYAAVSLTDCSVVLEAP